MSRKRLEAGISIAPNGMVLKGKPRDVMRMLNDLETTHGEDATVKDIYASTMDAILHPLVPVDANIRNDND